MLGTVLMRSAGVAVNDFADRNFDAHVERTRNRPLATGAVKPVEALILAAVLALIAFVLILPLGRNVILLSFCALFLAVSYPFTKRFFALPQAYLGVAFGFGIPMAYAAHTGRCRRSAGCCCWPISSGPSPTTPNTRWWIETTIAKLGIRTSAILFGRFDVAAVMLCHACFSGDHVLGRAGARRWRGRTTPGCCAQLCWWLTNTS